MSTDVAAGRIRRRQRLKSRQGLGLSRGVSNDATSKAFLSGEVDRLCYKETVRPAIAMSTKPFLNNFFLASL